MSSLSMRRFHPSTFTTAEAYQRATHTPRNVRTLAQAVLTWTLWNIRHDAASPWGDLPLRYGFQCSSGAGRPLYVRSMSAQSRLAVTSSALVCGNDADGGTFVAAASFEPLRGVWPSPLTPASIDAQTGARRCASPVDWVLAWNGLAAAFEALSDYERRILDSRGLQYRASMAADRPRSVRRAEVEPAELPVALRAVAEWCEDGEQAMLAWIIADAKARGVDANLGGLQYPLLR